jgi:predicted alpha/beta hydrolase
MSISHGGRYLIVVSFSQTMLLFLCRGLLIIATPYGSGFDHFRISDEAQFKFDRCLRKLKEDSFELDAVPVYGIGHSLGALAHLLIGARYAVERQGNVLISFNNKVRSARLIPGQGSFSASKDTRI